MDFFRAGAIPALIALAFSLPALGAGCEALDGTYHFVSEPVAGMQPMTFNMLVNLKRGEGEKVVRWDKASAPKSWTSTEPMARPKQTYLASKVKLEYTPAGGKVIFLDDSGTALTEAGLDSLGKWTCRGDHLERSSERMAGSGGEIRTEKLEQSLRRKGEVLVLTDTVAVVDPPGGKPRTSEVRFRAAR